MNLVVAVTWPLGISVSCPRSRIFVKLGQCGEFSKIGEMQVIGRREAIAMIFLLRVVMIVQNLITKELALSSEDSFINTALLRGGLSDSSATWQGQ